jgi:hypothetical protein
MKQDDYLLNTLGYLAITIGTLITLLSAVTTLNVLVDPFGINWLVAKEGFNAYKPAMYARVRLYKAFEVTRRKPQAIILGTSRTHLGLRCSHEAWAGLEDRCYNLAFDGATTREMYHYLRHAHAGSRLQLVVLGLDTYHLTSAPSFTRPDFDERVLDSPDGRLPGQFISGELRLLVNMDTLRASLKTIASQGHAEPSWFAANGQRLGPVFFHREGEHFLEFGPRAYFDEIDRLEVGFQTESVARAPVKRSRPPSTVPADPEESSLAYIQRIITFCRAENIDLRIFITPSHAHQLEIAAATGAEPAIENGKRELVRLLAVDASQHRDLQPIRLIDFSGYSSITTETLPVVGSRDEMRFYWDSSHFKEIVGDYVLDRLFDMNSPVRPVPSDLGMDLTSDTVEAVLAWQHREQAAYRDRSAADVHKLRSLVQTAVVRE